MKKLISILLVVLFILLSGCNRTANIPAFYGEFCDAQRTSYRDVNGLKETPSKVAWKHDDLSEAYEALLLTTNAPTIEGNRAYLVSGGVITVVDLETGKEIWRKDYYTGPSPLGVPPDYKSDFSSAFFNSPVIYGDKIVILGGFSREFLLVIDKNTGEPIWKSEVIGGDSTGPSSQHLLIISGRIYLAATNVEGYKKNGEAEAGIWVWDVNTGKVLNKIFLEPIAEPIVGKYRSMWPAYASLAADGPNIYGATRFTNDSTYRTYIFCYDTSRKKFTWFAPIEEGDVDYPGQIIRIAVNENFVAVCMVGDQWMGKEPQFLIKVFDKTSHRPLWQNISKTVKKLNAVLSIGMFAVHDDKLYTILFDKRFVCFDMKTGKEVWSFKDKDWQSEWWNKWNGYEDCFLEHDVVVTKDVVYFNVGNAIYAIDPVSGKLLWRKVVEKSNLFINIMPIENGLIVRYQDIQIGYDTPQNPITCECWKGN